MDTFRTCPNCHASVNSCFPFCDQCGSPMSDEPKPQPEPEKTFDYTLTPTQTTVTPTVGKKIPVRPIKALKRRPVYLIVSIVLYSLAACFLVACLVNMLSALSVQSSFFGGLTAGNAMPAIASCIFNGILSVILTVLGSTFLLLFQLDK